MADLFVKLDHKLLSSSIMDEELAVRWVWIVCLLLSDASGRFRSTPTALARHANVPVRDVSLALDVLTAPDPSSTTEEHEGRRLISEGPNQWWIPNKARYRAATDADAVRRYERNRKREQRARASSSSDSSSSETETESEIESESERSPGKSGTTHKPKGARFTPPELEEVESYATQYMDDLGVAGRNPGPAFVDHFMSNGWRVSGRSPMRDWRAALRNWIRRDVESGRLRPRPDASDWILDTYRRSDYDRFKDHKSWPVYLESAAELPPRSAPTFTEWRDGRETQ